eukprot:9482784-Pyramimonas_sp.AAC.1
MNMWASTGAGNPALIEAGCRAVGPASTVSSMTRRRGAPEYQGLAAMVNAAVPSASAATSNSSTFIARCPEVVYATSITLAPFQRGRLCMSEPGMTIFCLPLS